MSSTPTFDFTRLPYELRMLIYEQLSTMELRTLLTLTKKYNLLFDDVEKYFSSWTIKQNSIYSVDFHYRALSSSRRREYVNHLSIDYYVNERNIANTISKFTCAVFRMKSLQSLELDFTGLRYRSEDDPTVCVPVPSGRSCYTCGSGRDRDIEAQLIDFVLPSETVEELVLCFRSSKHIKPNRFPYAELLDRYPNLKKLAIWFAQRDNELDELMELYLASLPVRNLVIGYQCDKKDGSIPQSKLSVFNKVTTSHLQRVQQNEKTGLIAQFRHIDDLAK